MHELPEAVRRNRTHLVWHGDASPSLRRLMAVLEEAEAGRIPDRPENASIAP
jgi:hypothetical protein